jgi:hypothetical protein
MILNMNDLKVGLPELMINCEMAIFGILHLWAFSWKSYTREGPEMKYTEYSHLTVDHQLREPNFEIVHSHFISLYTKVDGTA